MTRQEYHFKGGDKMSIVYNSTKTADTINRAIDNSQGTTTTTQGAAHAGEIITEDLQPVVQCTGGYTNPVTVKTISGVPPVEFHAVERNLKFWVISGNTVEGTSVGEKTENLWNNHFTAGYQLSPVTGLPVEYATNNSRMSMLIPIDVSSTNSVTYNFTNLTTSAFSVMYSILDENDTLIERVANKTVPFTINTTNATKLYIAVYRASGNEDISENMITNIMLNTGDTAKPFEPFGYKVPIVCANVTYNCYISDVLRKSTPATRKRKSKKAVNDTTVYDVMDSTGTVYRNVDTDGTPLETPVTETYTAPTITTIWGYNEFDVDTTVTPSNVTVQYYDN